MHKDLHNRFVFRNFAAKCNFTQLNSYAYEK